MSILLTGASGNLGAELAKALAAQGNAVICTTHAARDLIANDGQQIPTKPFAGAISPGVIQTVQADISRPGLGLDLSAAQRLSECVEHVIHSAAVTEFGAPDALYRAVNVEGARNVVAFARMLPRLKGLIHLSTAYVAGLSEGPFGAGDLDRGQAFGNGYEASKFEAEILIQSAMRDGLPAIVLRPSIVVGDSLTGQIRDFKHFFPVLRIIGSGRVSLVPGDPDASLDLVPIDHVVKAVLAALNDFERHRGKTFNIVSGAPVSMAAVCDALDAAPGMQAPTIAVPSDFELAMLPASERPFYQRVVSQFATYFQRRACFVANSDELGLAAPPDGATLLARLIAYGRQAGYLRGRALAEP